MRILKALALLPVALGVEVAVAQPEATQPEATQSEPSQSEGAQSEGAQSEAEALLARAIAYHDPSGAWAEGSFALEIAESRPDGSTRATSVAVDNRKGRFEYRSWRDGRRIEAELGPEECTLRLDGSTEFSREEAETFRLSCERLARIRNYYVYLWGLPMKLRDPGTRVAPEVDSTEFAGRPAHRIKVTYDETVGGDTWYFYLDPAGAALIGYRFYHDEAAGDGEYIVLEGELAAAGLRLPRSRTWYTNAEDELLGTDTLQSLDARD